MTQEADRERRGLSIAGQSAKGGRSGKECLAIGLRWHWQDAGFVGAGAAAIAATRHRSFANFVPNLYQGRRGRNGGADQ